MADDNQEIKIYITAEGVAQAQAGMKQVGKSAADMGAVVEDSHGKATAGAKGFSFAAKGLAHELGVTGGMARYFGHEVMDLTTGMGVAAMTLGVVSLAAMAAYKIYEHFREAAKKQREELEKSVTTTFEHTRALYANKLETEALVRDKREFDELEQRIFERDTPKLIDLQTAEIEKLNKKLEDGVGILQHWWIWWKAGFDPRKNAHEEAKKQMDEINQKLQDRIDKLKVQIQTEKDQMDAARTDTKLEGPWSPEYTAMVGKNILDMEQKERDYYDNTVFPYLKQSMELEDEYYNKVVFVNMQEWFLMEQDRAKRVEQVNFTRNMLKIRTDAAEQAAKAEINLERNAQQMKLNIASQAIDGYIAVTGKQNAVLFTLQKALAVGQIWVDTQRASMAAAASVAGIPIIGPEMAAAAYAEMQALGQVSMAIAAATALGQLATGTWSGAKSPTPTVATNSISGLPQSQYTADYGAQFGTGWRPGEGQDRGGMTVHVYGNVYAQDDASFRKKIAAAVVTDYNDGGVVKQKMIDRAMRR